VKAERSNHQVYFVETEMKIDKDFLNNYKLEQAIQAVEADNYLEALVLLESYLDDDPNAKECLFLLGHVYQNLGNRAAALITHRHSVLLSPDEAEAHVSLAFAAFEMFLFDEAIQAAHQAIELSNHYKGWRIKGLAFEHIGHQNIAEQIYQKAFEIQPTLNPIPKEISPIDARRLIEKSFEKLDLSDEHPLRHMTIRWEHFPPIPALFDGKKSPRQAVQFINDELHIYLGNLKYQYPEEPPSEDLILYGIQNIILLNQEFDNNTSPD
jgi:tetratricopeptide (TPR) repeat protein